jgi:hypothetical protein
MAVTKSSASRLCSINVPAADTVQRNPPVIPWLSS